MKGIGLLFAWLMSIAMTRAGQGKIVFEGTTFSRHFNTNRIVRIYLPPSYEREPGRRFPVLYLHDGQNAFTTVGTNVAFGWGNWELDKTVNAVSTAGKMQEIIMVAVDCSAERYLDYRGPVYGRSRDSEPRNLKGPPPEEGKGLGTFR